ncbi:hypothetical protein ABKV19_021319 [Rosa sericea]
MDDKDLDDAALWAVIDSAAASHSSKSKFQSRQPLAIQYQRPSPPISNPSPPQKLFKTARISYSAESDSKSEGEVVEEPWAFLPPRKIARSANDGNSLAVVRNVPRTPTTPVYASPESHLSPGIGRFSSPVSYPQREEGDNNPVQTVQHSLSGMFPSVSLFKEYQDAAMAVGGRYRFTSISLLRSRTRALSLMRVEMFCVQSLWFGHTCRVVGSQMDGARVIGVRRDSTNQIMIFQVQQKPGRKIKHPRTC